MSIFSLSLGLSFPFLFFWLLKLNTCEAHSVITVHQATSSTIGIGRLLGEKNEEIRTHTHSQKLREFCCSFVVPIISFYFIFRSTSFYIASYIEHVLYFHVPFPSSLARSLTRSPNSPSKRVVIIQPDLLIPFSTRHHHLCLLFRSCSLSLSLSFTLEFPFEKNSSTTLHKMKIFIENF
jgi:hypothetical protein